MSELIKKEMYDISELFNSSDTHAHGLQHSVSQATNGNFNPAFVMGDLG